jgi:Sgf11 (transcriptional regulation protein)
MVEFDVGRMKERQGPTPAAAISRVRVDEPPAVGTRRQLAESSFIERRELYPSVYRNNAQAEDHFEFAVEIPSPPVRQARRQHPHLTPSDVPPHHETDASYGLPNSSNDVPGDGATGNVASSAGSAQHPGIVTRQQSSYTQKDIWGRIPSKEPRFLVTCSICGRAVAASRFAPHLDKCMGLGVGARANSSSNSAR